MKILYGVQGTGNGHITRARAMATEFSKRGMAVDYLFSGREPDRFFDMEAFGDYRVQPGFTFITRNGRIRSLATVFGNRPLRYLQDIRELDLDGYDLVLTDFEPVTAWAGRLRRKTVVGMGHQYAFRFPIPQHHGDLSQRLVINHFAPADISLGLHWHHFDQPILPPIAPVEQGASEIRRRQYTVYLPFESPDDIRRLLSPFDQYSFQIYHPDTVAGSENHLQWHPPGRSTFQAALRRSEGVICNAGFELASEVLQLGKKLLVKPVLGQSEQYSNTLAIDLLGYGHVMYQLDPQKTARWLESGCAIRIHYPDVAAAICDWLLAGADGDVAALAARLWRQTQLPDMTPATRTEDDISLALAVDNDVHRPGARPLSGSR